MTEWIEFHRLVGAEHFYLYNNNSSDDYKAVLAPFQQEGIVTLYEWPNVPASPGAEEHCVKNHARDARWIAILDDDEFLFSPCADDIRPILNNYRDFPAIAVHWLIFGSSGHIERPEGGVIQSYTQCASRVSETIKSIVNPRRVKAGKSTHYMLYKDDAIAVNEKKQSVKVSHSKPPTAEFLRINHCWSKSLEDGRNKIGRGSAVDQWGITNPRSMDFWHRHDAANNAVEDLAIQRFLPALKAKLAARGQQMAARTEPS